MKTAKRERILLSEDLKSLNDIISYFNYRKPYIQKLKIAYSTLELGEFNDDVYQKIISNGTAPVEKLYRQTLDSNLDALGIKSTLIRSNMVTSHEEVITPFRQAYNTLISRANEFAHYNIGTFPLSTIRIVDGEPVLPEAEIELIKEKYCRIYVTSDQEFEVYDAIQHFITSYNSMLKVFDNSNYRQHFYLERLNYLVIEHDDRTLSLNPDSIARVINCDAQYRQAMSYSANYSQMMSKKAA